VGITYQTNNRQRRKVMTAPLNAPPSDLVAADEAIADLPAAPASSHAARPGFFWVAAAVAGAVCAAYCLNLFF
jgi:hypothetical protein